MLLSISIWINHRWEGRLPLVSSIHTHMNACTHTYAHINMLTVLNEDWNFKNKFYLHSYVCLFNSAMRFILASLYCYKHVSNLISSHSYLMVLVLVYGINVENHTWMCIIFHTNAIHFRVLLEWDNYIDFNCPNAVCFDGTYSNKERKMTDRTKQALW